MLAALVANRRIHSICCTGCSFSCFLAVVNASYLYIISIAPVLRLAVWGTLQEVRVYWYGCVEACGSVLLRHGLNFSTDWCTMRLISVEKDWKHVLTHKVVTLNTCCDIACLTFQLPHITTGYFQSHRRQPTTGSFWSFQRLKERNKPSEKVSQFTSYCGVIFRWGGQVDYSLFSSEITKIIRSMNEYCSKWLFSISQGKVATFDRWGGRTSNSVHVVRLLW